MLGSERRSFQQSYPFRAWMSAAHVCFGSFVCARCLFRFASVSCRAVTGIAEIFVGFLVAVAVLALVARRLTIPYPILFVIGGLCLGLIPKLPKVRLEPDLVFLFVLPPLLFPAALFTSWRDFRTNLRPISLLAIGLVLFTTLAVAWLASYFM